MAVRRYSPFDYSVDWKDPAERQNSSFCWFGNSIPKLYQTDELFAGLRRIWLRPYREKSRIPVHQHTVDKALLIADAERVDAIRNGRKLLTEEEKRYLEWERAQTELDPDGSREREREAQSQKRAEKSRLQSERSLAKALQALGSNQQSFGNWQEREKGSIRLRNKLRDWVESILPSQKRLIRHYRIRFLTRRQWKYAMPRLSKPLYWNQDGTPRYPLPQKD
jgi:hypothetical protein